MTDTYLKAEKDGALCSVASPKPRSDLKNRKLTPTILRAPCHLNHMKCVSSVHDCPCFSCLLYLCSKVSAGVWLCHHWPPGGVDLALIQAHLIRSGRLSNLTCNAMDAHAAVPHLGHASCFSSKNIPCSLFCLIIPTSGRSTSTVLEHRVDSPAELHFPNISSSSFHRLELRSGILHLSLQ